MTIGPLGPYAAKILSRVPHRILLHMLGMTLRKRDYSFSADWFSQNVPLFERYVLPLAGSPCNLLEIGTHEGRSTTWLADHILTHSKARLDAIDPWPCNALWTNISRTRRSLQITVHQGASRDVMRRLPPDTFDFIYVDGSHSTVDVMEDAVSAFRLAKSGAVIAFDDYQWDDPNFKQSGVPKPAIDAFLALYAHPTRYDPLVDVLEMGWQVWVRKR
jgi:predicted O-methyltransferase YrrM